MMLQEFVMTKFFFTFYIFVYLSGTKSVLYYDFFLKSSA